jgi:alcohol dehydrogenase
MKALVYEGPGRSAWRDVPDPAAADPADAIVRVEATTTCGTYLHILKGDVPDVSPCTVGGAGHDALSVRTGEGM